MFIIYDGRESFYQWDLDRKLIVKDNTIKEVHFCNKTDDYSLVCETYTEGGLNIVNVPNILLQDNWRINVYAYDSKYTKFSAVFDVIKRSKPADYIYTETEIKRYEELENKVNHFEGEIRSLRNKDAEILDRIGILEEAEVDLTGYATQEYVDTAIEGIELSGGVTTDKTLSLEGVPADAKVTGNQIWNVRKYNGWIDTNTGVYIDTTAKTITFGANTHICWGVDRQNVGNTTHDISGVMGGGFLFYDATKKAVITTNTSTHYIYLGAFWKPYYLADLHMDKTKLYIDGMPVNYVGKYSGKTINVLGDSLTAGAGTTKAYHQWFGQLCGFKNIKVYGLGGSSITPIGSHEPAWTGEDSILSFYERYSDMGDADAISVMGCVNDWCCGRELGRITDTTTDTFYGTMKLLCEGLIAKYPTKDIYFFSSPQTDYIHRPANKIAGTNWAGNIEGYNRKGYKLEDYSRAMGEVCAIYGIPFMSLTDNCYWGLSGVLGEYQNDEVNGVYGNDSLHPNAEGHKRIALKMSSVINNGYGNYSPISEGLRLVSEKEITTEDNVSIVEFKDLENYDEAMLVVYCPWSGDLSATLTAVTQINGTQVEKDWYEFQTKSMSKYNVLRIKRIDDKYYDVLAYASTNSTRYSSSMKIRAIHKGTISKIGFSLSDAMKSQIYTGITTNCVVSCYAR